MNIVIYTKSNCPNCTTAKQLLKSKGIKLFRMNSVFNMAMPRDKIRELRKSL